jgi:hypothetical protein
VRRQKFHYLTAETRSRRRSKVVDPSPDSLSQARDFEVEKQAHPLVQELEI